MNVDGLLAHETVLAVALRDPAFRAEWERTALARAVAMRVLRHRAEHRLSQAALARQLGMQQPAMARLEPGDHTPSLDTPRRLSRGLGIHFHIDITPDDIRLTA